MTDNTATPGRLIGAVALLHTAVVTVLAMFGVGDRRTEAEAELARRADAATALDLLDFAHAPELVRGLTDELVDALADIAILIDVPLERSRMRELATANKSRYVVQAARRERERRATDPDYVPFSGPHPVFR